jgi:hypothetical protein
VADILLELAKLEMQVWQTGLIRDLLKDGLPPRA